MKTLEEWRRRQGISIVDLAAKAGVSNKTISDIENRKVVPRFRTVHRLCGALGLKPEDVTEFATPRPKAPAPEEG